MIKLTTLNNSGQESAAFVSADDIIAVLPPSGDYGNSKYKCILMMSNGMIIPVCNTADEIIKTTD